MGTNGQKGSACRRAGQGKDYSVGLGLGKKELGKEHKIVNYLEEVAQESNVTTF